MSTYVLGLDETTRSPKLWQKVSDSAPTNGYVLKWVAANSQWEAQAEASGGIADPSTKATNDLLQWGGASWDAKGAAVGDALTGPLYLGADLVMVGASGIDVLWNTDGGGDIGASGATRPNNIYAKTGIYQGSSQVLDTSLGGTKNTNDILQRTSGGTWDAVGGTVGDPILGTFYVSAVTHVGGSNTSPLLWATDNQNDIGASGATRPRTGYFGTSVVIAGQTAMKAGDSAAGGSCDLTGTYPSTLTVAKVQGYSMTSGAPNKGDAWRYDGSSWAHNRGYEKVLVGGDNTWNDSNLNTVCQYTTDTGQFSVYSMIIATFVVKNGANPTLEVSLYYGGTKICGVGGWTYSHNKVTIYAWASRENTNYCQWYYDNYGGVGTSDTSIGASWISTGATWYLRIQRTSGSGQYYVRAWLKEYQWE